MLLMGGPGGPRPPGGGVTGAEPPLRGVAEARRAGARGETSPLLYHTSRCLEYECQQKLRLESAIPGPNLFFHSVLPVNPANIENKTHKKSNRRDRETSINV
jgi:hypothetical protein